MDFKFTRTDIEKIAKALEIDFKDRGNNYRISLQSEDKTRKVSMEIYSDIPIGDKRGNLITVYTNCTHLQLHFCKGYVVSEMLGEVTFIGENNGFLSGLIIEKNAGCSMYANVDKEILSGDFTTLGPEVMMSGIALSLSETILEE
ncbi:MAG: hypothetical protein DWQ06_16755 [Calditrichaeota bacterium]|nr:MAG: hypothetical protein DWQ06_16755 [Calditrichota bacterium]